MVLKHHTPLPSPGGVTIFKENTVLVSITTAGGNSDVQSKDELAVLKRMTYPEPSLRGQDRQSWGSDCRTGDRMARAGTRRRGRVGLQ